MPPESLAGVIREEGFDLPDEDIQSALDRILSEPQQESLAEAVAADAVDVSPIAGDLLALSRRKKAEQQGTEYPDKPQYIEGALADIPDPFGDIASSVVAENTLKYLRDEYGINIAEKVDGVTESTAVATDESIDVLLPPDPTD
jgi:hypothetical protein